MDARNNTHIWGEQYNHRESDLLQVQADLSRKIAEALRLRLTAGERWQLAEPKMVNPKAYELILKGRFYWEKGTTGEQKKAIETTVVTSDNHH